MIISSQTYVDNPVSVPEEHQGTFGYATCGRGRRSTQRRCSTATCEVAVSLHYYNFARPHQSLKDVRGRPITPAMAAGVATHPWSTSQIAGLLD